MQFSEYVSLGHPDKMADYISEYILDRLISQDKKTRYALEVQVKDNNVTLGGEVTTYAHCDYDNWVREAIRDIGYTGEYATYWGDNNTVHPDRLIINKHISQQSGDIAFGVNQDAWGDQGIMFGMATDRAEYDYMTKDYYLAKKIGQTLFASGIGGLDIKTQVVCDGSLVRKIIVAIPTLRDVDLDVKGVIDEFVFDANYELIVNGTGKYIKHSSMGDCGTTGRKLVVDFYGGGCNIGGGSPWTKDGTKADLTLNLYARELALNFVKKNKVDYVRTGIECCIGRKNVSIVYWNSNNEVLHKEQVVVLPSELIERYKLNTPIYAYMCKNGLFSLIK